MKLTKERKKEIDELDDTHIFYFRNMFSDNECKYICETRKHFREILGHR